METKEDTNNIGINNTMPTLRLFKRRSNGDFIVDEVSVEASGWTIQEAVVGLDTAIDRLNKIELDINKQPPKKKNVLEGI